MLWAGKCMFFILVIANLGLTKVAADYICTLPAETGPCRASITRWTFNKHTGKCETFTYGGCGGNENNFKTKSECMGTCVCKLPKDTGSCSRDTERYYFNKEINKCQKFTYGGCGGNANRFITRRECQDKCICDLEPDTGPCRASMDMIYYNSDTDTCEQFTYGGCQGNGNRFHTKVGCQATCQINV